MLKNILLDLDDTILSFTKGEPEALSSMFSQIGFPLDEESLARYRQINRDHWRALEEGTMERHDVVTHRFTQLFKEYDFDGNAEQAHELYEQELSYRHYFVDGAEEFLQKIDPKYNLYIASNGTGFIQRRRLKEAKIEHYFKELFISEDIGYEKPSILFFNACFGEVEDFTQKNTIMIGDSLTSDMRGGIDAGIRTIWFNPNQLTNQTDIKPNYEVHELDEIHAILETL